MATRRREPVPRATRVEVDTVPRVRRWAEGVGLRVLGAGALPGERVALPSVGGASALLPTREPTPEMLPGAVRGTYGGPGIYDEIERQSPRVAAWVDALVGGIGTSAVEWRAADADAETESERRLRDDLTSLIESSTCDDTRGITGWPGHAEAVSMVPRRGHSLSALRWVPRPRARYHHAMIDGLGIEAYPVHASTVRSWDWDRQTGELRGVVQGVTGGTVALSICDLLYVSRGGVPGEWEGIATLRPIIFLHARWRELLAQAARLAALQGGTLVVTTPAGEDSENRDRINQTMQEWASGYAPYVVLPKGYALDSQAGVAPTALREQLEYIDQSIDHRLGDSLRSLGFSAHGSRALGEAMSASDEERARQRLDALVGAWGRALAEWVGRAVRFDGRLPVLATIGEEPAEDVATIISASSAGLIGSITEADIADVRARLGLPERPAPASAPAAMSDAHRLADRTMVVTDCTGQSVEVPRALAGPELWVAWADTRRTRERLDLRLGEDLEIIAERHQRTLWAALRDGWQPGEQARIYETYLPDYERALGAYRDTVGDAVREWTRDERERQRRAGTPVVGAQVSGLAQVRESALATIARTDAMVVQSARAVASAVQGEVEAAWAGGVPASRFRTAISTVQMSRHGRQIGQTMESEGRVAEAARIDGEDGLVIVSVVRTSVNDVSRCRVCTDRDGTEYRLPEERAAYEAMPLPDPMCIGSRYRGLYAGCRCGWLVEWGRVDDR